MLLVLSSHTLSSWSEMHLLLFSDFHLCWTLLCLWGGEKKEKLCMLFITCSPCVLLSCPTFFSAHTPTFPALPSLFLIQVPLILISLFPWLSISLSILLNLLTCVWCPPLPHYLLPVQLEMPALLWMNEG